MLRAYAVQDGALAPAAPEAAAWIDLFAPTPEEVATVAALAIDVPSLAIMESLEVSNRLVRDGGTHRMIVVLPGAGSDGGRTAGPVAFLVSDGRLVTVRHHTPLPFQTFPAHAPKTAAGCASPRRLFLGLMEEIVARLADLLEEVGRALDGLTPTIFTPDRRLRAADLRATLAGIGRQGETVSRVRLALLTVGRALSFFDQTLATQPEDAALRHALTRDVNALIGHTDFVSGRITLISDATMGVITVGHSETGRIVSLVSVFFLPATLVASVYGMNFANMPELSWTFGYPLALGIMVGFAALTFAVFRWRRLL